jgi:hypothetical protein
MQARERVIEGSVHASLIFNALKVEPGLEPLRREWCAGTEIDSPHVLDFSRCVFGMEQVLLPIRRLELSGRLIGQLLAADHAVDQDEAKSSDSNPLKPAPASEIHRAIGQAYDDATAAKQKPPNVKEIVAPVQAILAKDAFEAPGNRIQDLARDPRHADRRRKPGKTIASETRRSTRNIL